MSLGVVLVLQPSIKKQVKFNMLISAIYNANLVSVIKKDKGNRKVARKKTFYVESVAELEGKLGICSPLAFNCIVPLSLSLTDFQKGQTKAVQRLWHNNAIPVIS